MLKPIGEIVIETYRSYSLRAGECGASEQYNEKTYERRFKVVGHGTNFNGEPINILEPIGD